MNTKSEMAERAQDELTAASNALERAGALFRTVWQALVCCEECPPDVLSLAKIGGELCDTYSDRFDDAAGHFEEAAVSSRKQLDLQSSTGGE
jgi:hypothetical protein